MNGFAILLVVLYKCNIVEIPKNIIFISSATKTPLYVIFV